MLDRVGEGSKDIVEEPEGFIGLQEIRSHFKGILEALLVVMKACASVSNLVVFFGLQETGDTLYLF